MLKNILNLSEVSVISKKQQSSIKAGFDPNTPCHISAPCEPDQVYYQCYCQYPWEI